MKKKFKPKFDGHSICLQELKKNEWLAFLEIMPSVSAFGNTAGEAVDELLIAWEATKESYKKHKEEMTHPFLLWERSA